MAKTLNAAPTSKARRARPIKVGDRVTVRAASGRVPAIVVEDRGHLGVGGRRILRVRRTGPTDLEWPEYEVPEEDVAPATRRQQSAERPAKHTTAASSRPLTSG